MGARSSTWGWVPRSWGSRPPSTSASPCTCSGAKQEDSLALEADAHHLATDVYTSAGVGAGLLVVWLTGWQVADPLVAIAVALLIARIGWQLTMPPRTHVVVHVDPDSAVAQHVGR